MSTMLPQMIDPTVIPPSTGSGGGKQLPPSGSEGWPVVIKNTEVKPTSNGVGRNFIIEVEGTEGENIGKTCRRQINLIDGTGKTNDVGMKQISAIFWVTGTAAAQDAAILHGRACRAVIAMQEGSDKFTEIKFFLDSQGEQAGKQTLSSGSKVPKFTSPAPAAQAQQAPVAQAAPTAQPAVKRPWNQAKVQS